MAGDPYQALGLTKTATADDIKKAYRRIAKADHPDLNPDPAATTRFKAASAAYDLLKDAEQRRRFDAGEIDAQGQERPQQRYYRPHAEQASNPYAQSHGFDSDPDLSGVFDDLFGARARRGGYGGGYGGYGGQARDRDGPDYRFALTVDFLTAARGGTTQITLPEGGTLSVTIPRGLRDGQAIRLRGKGGPGIGQGQPGDALLEISVSDHPTFRREGDDVHITLPITLDEAILGGKVATPTIDGTVNLTIPSGATSGQRLRLRGRGINGGDQHVELRVMTPPQIDDDLADFMRRWRDTHPYDPRKGMAI
ncbi:DnaJ C-terminal domain-containing protein [Paracoccus sp. (in: a-proteobacteria)]|uniref:DnaJ C-terminal domain-containing protein n=1 Tax=Paracoccus sp. TaxID=267 RepID=UPI0026DF7CBF|nr:DnaJ C-terminal domain-containing protein [Paracoccus sp. (in: a-proteobacteria)]MDO5646997.1 DnaJ C-terminal domain-containing protein [Paracoccus sp. (in: a-proteobacteria)]